MECQILDLVLLLVLIQERLVLGHEAVFNGSKSLGELLCISDPWCMLSQPHALHVLRL